VHLLARAGLEVNALKSAPDLVRRALEQAPHIKAIAKRYAKYHDMLFLGRLSLFQPVGCPPHAVGRLPCHFRGETRLTAVRGPRGHFAQVRSVGCRRQTVVV